MEMFHKEYNLGNVAYDDCTQTAGPHTRFQFIPLLTVRLKAKPPPFLIFYKHTHTHTVGLKWSRIRGVFFPIIQHYRLDFLHFPPLVTTNNHRVIADMDIRRLQITMDE
ncbi:hypothetical protein L2E82_12646 [Cichorium intybus]|uniref:Uncharacterized protein n=1 Tax=Cichorium intybus TaxID=13427 RepID=A0ACB9GGN7_CICIN|nr:hypothetical protein L2E82_12646 [Cichorium intybus]